MKRALPMLFALDNIIDDYINFEDYVSREHYLHDINDDGKVEMWEQKYYDDHYKWIRGFWNHSKGLGEVRETIPDDGILTFEQYKKQDNLILKRDYPNSDIPDERFEQSFKDSDRDGDGQLTWWEYYSTIAFYHKHWYQWNNLYDSIDQQQKDEVGYGELTRDEVRDYYNFLNVDGGLTAEEIENKVEDFFNLYSHGKG